MIQCMSIIRYTYTREKYFPHNSINRKYSSSFVTRRFFVKLTTFRICQGEIFCSAHQIFYIHFAHFAYLIISTKTELTNHERDFMWFCHTNITQNSFLSINTHFARHLTLLNKVSNGAAHIIFQTVSPPFRIFSCAYFYRRYTLANCMEWQA